MHCVFDSLCEMHSLVFVLNRSKVKATFETAFEIVFETFHATNYNLFLTIINFKGYEQRRWRRGISCTHQSQTRNHNER